jgi:hypothetical protein
MKIAFLVYDTHHPNITVHSWRDRAMVLTGPSLRLKSAVQQLL